MEYYYEALGKTYGPISREQLLEKISKETLVWHSGLSDWTKASSIESLREFFLNVPPPLPIPTQEKPFKVEAVIKKETKQVFTEEKQVIIANEIKVIFIIALISLFISFFTYIIYKQNLDYGKYDSLQNGLESYDKAHFSMILSKHYSDWVNENKEWEDSLYRLASDYNCLIKTDYTQKFNDIGRTVECLKYKMEVINNKSFSIAKNAFFICLIILLIMRYTFFATKWVIKKSNNDSKEI